MKAFTGAVIAASLLIFGSVPRLAAIDVPGAGAPTSAGATDVQAERAARVAEVVRRELSIGVVSLTMLMRSGARFHVREESLSGSERQGIGELAAEGLVTVNRISAAEGVFLNVVPTDRGAALVSALGGGIPR